MLSVRIRPGLPDSITRVRNIELPKKEKVEITQEVKTTPRPQITRKVSMEDFRVEFSRIEWPVRKEIIKSTNAVFVIMVTFMVGIGVVDFGLTKLLTLVQTLK